jgi:hypothetical protein
MLGAAEDAGRAPKRRIPLYLRPLEGGTEDAHLLVFIGFPFCEEKKVRPRKIICSVLFTLVSG